LNKGKGILCLEGKAEVITKDVRLIERIFNELRDVFDAK